MPPVSVYASTAKTIDPDQPHQFFLRHHSSQLNSILGYGIPVPPAGAKHEWTLLQSLPRWKVLIPQPTSASETNEQAATIASGDSWPRFVAFVRPADVKDVGVPMQPAMPLWQPDTDRCARCIDTTFSVFKRRHHCRLCGLCVCKACMSKTRVHTAWHVSKQLICCACAGEQVGSDSSAAAGTVPDSDVDELDENNDSAKVHEGRKEGTLKTSSCDIGEENGLEAKLPSYDDSDDAVPVCPEYKALHSELMLAPKSAPAYCQSGFPRLSAKQKGTIHLSARKVRTLNGAELKVMGPDLMELARSAGFAEPPTLRVVEVTVHDVFNVPGYFSKSGLVPRGFRVSVTDSSGAAASSEVLYAREEAKQEAESAPGLGALLPPKRSSGASVRFLLPTFARTHHILTVQVYARSGELILTDFLSCADFPSQTTAEGITLLDRVKVEEDGQANAKRKLFRAFARCSMTVSAPSLSTYCLVAKRKLFSGVWDVHLGETVAKSEGMLMYSIQKKSMFNKDFIVLHGPRNRILYRISRVDSFLGGSTWMVTSLSRSVTHAITSFHSMGKVKWHVVLCTAEKGLSNVVGSVNRKLLRSLPPDYVCPSHPVNSSVLWKLHRRFFHFQQ